MPSSEPRDWCDRLYCDLSRDERAKTTGSPTQASREPPSRKPLPETLTGIPRYEVSAVIGEGASGVVYKAWDCELHRPVALKVLRPLVANTEVARQRFRREAKAAASLSHPHVVAAYDAGEHEGVMYLVMELVEGRPLSEVLAPGGRPRTDLVPLLEQAARGVGEAHAKGIVHRDLKPANILVTASAGPKVADFGLAHLVDSSTHLTRSGSALGTPLYMSPEQVQGHVDQITPRTDVYSLGAILYELLTGRPPHGGATVMDLYGRIVREEPTAPRVLVPETPRDLEVIALKALDKEPARRYATASEFANDLRRHFDGEPVEARTAGMLYRAYRRWRRNRIAYSLSLGAGLALLLAGMVWVEARSEREKKVAVMRDYLRTTGDVLLKFRRAGANHEMGAYVQKLEEAYRQAVENDPNNPEIEYLMGRVSRALMDNERAEEFQALALAKNPEFAPALYEQAILWTFRLGAQWEKAIRGSRSLPADSGTAEAAREAPVPEPEDVELRHQRLVELRDRIRRDCASLQRAIASGQRGAGLAYVTEAHVRTAEGVVEYHRREYDEARRILTEVVRKDPTIEEAWAALCMAEVRRAHLLDSRSENRKEVLRAFDEVESLWTRAISHDAGYVPHLLGRADSSRWKGQILEVLGEDPVSEYRKAEADLTQVLEYESNAFEALHRRGTVRTLIGAEFMGPGQDPTPYFDGADQDFSDALSRSGDRSELRTARGNLHYQRALFRARRDQDPFPEYSAAEADLRKAIELDVQNEGNHAYASLGSLLLSRAVACKRTGRDPLPDLDGAVATFTQLVLRSRASAGAWARLGHARLERGLHRSELGQDPFEDLVAAERDCSEGIRLSPGRAAGSWGRRGMVRTHLGRCFESRKETEKAADKYAEALIDFNKAFEVNEALRGKYDSTADEARIRRNALRPN